MDARRLQTDLENVARIESNSTNPPLASFGFQRIVGTHRTAPADSSMRADLLAVPSKEAVARVGR